MPLIATTWLLCIGMCSIMSHGPFSKPKLVIIHLVLLLALGFQQVLERERNLFEAIKVIPNARESFQIRLQLMRNKDIIKAMDETVVKRVRDVLLDDKRRYEYMMFGEREEMKNATDTAEFVVRVLGQSFVWYLCAFCVLQALTWKKTMSGATLWGYFGLVAMAFVEVVMKTSSQGEDWLFRFKSLPYHTPYDHVELIKVVACYGYALVLTFYAIFSSDMKVVISDALERMCKRYDIFLSIQKSGLSKEKQLSGEENDERLVDLQNSTTKRVVAPPKAGSEDSSGNVRKRR